MATTPAIAWAHGERRFVGRYRITDRALHLEGTTTAASREYASVDIPLASIRRSVVADAHGSPAAWLETDAEMFVVELVTGSRADAHALIENLGC